MVGVYNQICFDHFVDAGQVDRALQPSVGLRVLRHRMVAPYVVER